MNHCDVQSITELRFSKVTDMRKKKEVNINVPSFPIPMLRTGITEQSDV